MIDAPDRSEARFPQEKAEAVRREIAQHLERWQIGPGDLAICGGACGADILFAEECLNRGAHLRLLLAQKRDDFVHDSVQHAGKHWVERFDAVCERAEVATLPERSGESSASESIYARTNLWIINNARLEASECGKIHALLVWDEKPTGDGPGGTSDFAARVRTLGGIFEIINPTTIS